MSTCRWPVAVFPWVGRDFPRSNEECASPLRSREASIDPEGTGGLVRVAVTTFSVVGACTPLRGGGIGSSAKGRLSAGGPPERAAGEENLGGGGYGTVDARGVVGGRARLKRVSRRADVNRFVAKAPYPPLGGFTSSVPGDQEECHPRLRYRSLDTLDTLL